MPKNTFATRAKEIITIRGCGLSSSPVLPRNRVETRIASNEDYNLETHIFFFFFLIRTIGNNYWKQLWDRWSIDPIPITWKWNDLWVVGKSSILSRDIIDHSSNTGTPVLMFMDIPMISNYISNGHRPAVLTVNLSTTSGSNCIDNASVNCR